MNERIMVRVPEGVFLSEAEVERLGAQAKRWATLGGVVVLQSGVTIERLDREAPTAPPEGVSTEMVGWALEASEVSK